jgi:hypothetical protein
VLERKILLAADWLDLFFDCASAEHGREHDER